MDLNDKDKKLLAYIAEPRSIANIAANTGFSFSYTSQRLSILSELGLCKKLTGNKKVLYISIKKGD